MDWDDVDRVCKYNEALRNKVNRILGSTWKKAMRLPKRDLKRTIIEYPEVLKDLVRQYREKAKRPYDFDRDPLGELLWAKASEKATKQYPLNLGSLKPLDANKVFQVAKTIAEQYSSLLENNGLNDLLYDRGKLKPERAAQLLFYGIAESYCEANDLDLSREPNAGVGALDFKVSKGFHAKTTVEVKYSSNPKLLHGYEKQLPTYNKAEKATQSIYLVIRTGSHDKKMKDLKAVGEKEVQAGRRAPVIIIADGRRYRSASKR